MNCETGCLILKISNQYYLKLSFQMLCIKFKIMALFWKALRIILEIYTFLKHVA